MKNSTLAFIIGLVVIILYGVIACIGTKNMAPWTDNELAVILPIGILVGIVAGVCEGLKKKEKEEEK